MDPALQRLSPLRDLPVFPLHNTVLFPGVVLPLQITDTRYQALISHAMKEGGELVVVMSPSQDALTADWSWASTGCWGEIIHLEHSAKHGYDVLIQGKERVRLVEQLPKLGSCPHYRVAPLPPLAEAVLKTTQREIVMLHSVMVSLVNAIQKTDEALLEILSATSDPVALVDILSAVLVSDLNMQQHLLNAEDLRTRLTLLLDCLLDTLVQAGASSLHHLRM